MTASRPLPAMWTARYLALLGVEHAAPGLATLARLSRAHPDRVLFGTILSLQRKQAHPTGPVPPLDLAEILASWERGVGSGVCFETSEMVHRLLTSLGYRAHIVLGTIFWPGDHQAVVVELDGRRYLVDVGNGAPFFDPIPLEGAFEIHHVGLSYRLHPGEDDDTWVQDRWIDSAWQPFCTYDLRPTTAADREAGYQRHHVSGESFVVSALRAIRCTDEAVSVLGEGSLTQFTAAGKRVETFEDQAEYARIAAEVLGAPDLPIGAARAALASIRQVADTPASPDDVPA